MPDVSWAIPEISDYLLPMNGHMEGIGAMLDPHMGFWVTGRSQAIKEEDALQGGGDEDESSWQELGEALQPEIHLETDCVSTNFPWYQCP